MDASRNRLTGWPVLPPTPSLIKVNLNGNNITSIDGDSLVHPANIEATKVAHHLQPCGAAHLALRAREGAGREALAKVQ